MDIVAKYIALPDIDWDIVFYAACKFDFPQMIHYILKFKETIDISFGLSAACITDNIPLIKYLLRYGKNNNKQIETCEWNIIYCKISQCQLLSTVKFMFNIMPMPDQETLNLMFKCSMINGNLPIIRYLYSLGITNINDAFGEACFLQNKMVMRQLISWGADTCDKHNCPAAECLK